MKDDRIDISIIMPCMDEEATVGLCIDEAKQALTDCGRNGEIIVVDNDSADASARIAADHGSTVIKEKQKGYGHAIRRGLREAKGEMIVIADCDMTYDLYDMKPMIEMMTDGGFDMVIGDRFAGGMEKGSMPFCHKAGVKALSALGRIRFKTDIHDFHSGIRGVRKDAVDKLNLRSGGMEFATEMIAEGARKGLIIGQIPVKLRKCPYSRQSKLRIVRDGFRHLFYILG